MDMASLMAAQQLLAGSGGNSLTASQQQQLLASLAGMSTGQTYGGGKERREENSGLTQAQQQLLAAAGTSLTSVQGGKDPYGSRSSTPSNTSGRPRVDSNTPSRPPAPSTPPTPMSMTLPPMPGTNGSLDPASQTKYQQLLSVIEEMSKDIRPCYAGSKSSAERLKRGIVYARILVRECLVEAERSART